MATKIVQLHLPGFEPKEMTKDEVIKYFNALFAQNSAIIKNIKKIANKADELDAVVFGMKKRLDNISENYLEKIP